MKSKFKKLSAILVVMAMLIITALPVASAATNNFLLDTSRKVSITLNCSEPDYTFEVFKIASLERTSESPYETKYTSLIPDVTSSSLQSDIWNGKTRKVVKTLDNIKTLPSTATSQGKFVTSKTSSTKTFSNLDQGIYYIRAIAYPATVKSVTNSVIALPYCSDEGWVYTYDDIELASKIKADKPEIHKVITNSTQDDERYTDVKLGDTVMFKLTADTAGSTEIKLNKFIISDEMSKGLTLNDKSFTVYVEDEAGSKVENLTANTDYTLNITEQTAGSDTKFNISLTTTYLNKPNFYSAKAKKLAVEYSAVLNKYAVVGVTGNPNKDKLEYGNESSSDSADGDTVYVYTYAATTFKRDKSDGKALNGAKFGLYTTLTTDENGSEKVENQLGKGVSDNNGKVTYLNSKGEELRLASGTYYVVELEAPTGYNLYGKAVPLTIDVSYGDTLVNGTYVVNSPKDGYASVDVNDTKVLSAIS